MLLFHMAVEVVDVHLHLPQVLMRQLVRFQINQHIALQKTVVKHQIHKKAVLLVSEALLSRLEEEALAKLKKERLQLGYDGGFEIGFSICRPLFHTEKFKDKRVFQHVTRFFEGLAIACEAQDFRLVAGKGEAFIQAASILSLQLAHCPLLFFRLDFVETPLLSVFYAK